jgi:hypothetical protein
MNFFIFSLRTRKIKARLKHTRKFNLSLSIRSGAFEVTHFFGRLSEALEIQDKTIDQRGSCCEV